MTKATAEQIAAEIAELKRLRPLIAPRTAFGDDNLTAIDAQIRVAEENLSDDDIHDEWNGDERALESALDMRNWLDDPASFDESPSGPGGWASLVGVKVEPIQRGPLLHLTHATPHNDDDDWNDDEDDELPF